MTIAPRHWTSTQRTRKGRSSIPIAEVLREHLAARRLRTGGRGLVFGDGDRPFRPDEIQRRDDYDLYGHLMPGNEAEAASLLDAYLKRTVGS